MKIFKKVIYIVLIYSLVCAFSNVNVVFAKKSSTDLSTIEKQAEKFITDGKKNNKQLGVVAEAVTENFVGLGQILTVVGAGIYVAVISYMGILYLTSSPEKQAALKQQLIGVVVSGIVIFGAYGIWKAVLGVVSNF